MMMLNPTDSAGNSSTNKNQNTNHCDTRKSDYSESINVMKTKQGIIQLLESNDPELTVLDLSDSSIDHDDIQEIANLLVRVNTHVQEINLSSNYLDSHDIMATPSSTDQPTTNTTTVASINNNHSSADQPPSPHPFTDVLEHNQNITRLDLSSNDIDDEAVIAMIQAMMRSSSLSSTLSTSTLTSASTPSYTNLRVWNLGRNSITEEGAIAIASFLRQQSERASRQQRRRRGSSHPITQKSKNHTPMKSISSTNHSDTGFLTELNLSWNDIRHQGALAIAESLHGPTIHDPHRLPLLQVLDLSWSNLESPTVAAIADMLFTNNTLTTLLLNVNRAGPLGARRIAKALECNTQTALTTLDLSNNRLGCEEATALAKMLQKNTVLAVLKLNLNRIGDEGATQLAKALRQQKDQQQPHPYYSIHDDQSSQPPSQTSLTELYLGWNAIGNVGACAFADTLRTNTVLTKLDLSQNQRIGHEGAVALSEGLKHNISLSWLGDKFPKASYLLRGSSKSLSGNAGKNQMLKLQVHEAGLMAHILAKTDRVAFFHYQLSLRIDLIIPGLLCRGENDHDDNNNLAMKGLKNDDDDDDDNHDHYDDDEDDDYME